MRSYFKIPHADSDCELSLLLLVIYHTHLANKELQMISSCLNWSCELQPYLPKSLVFMLDTCKIWAGKKKWWKRKKKHTTDRYVDLLMVPRGPEPHPELEGVILSSQPGRCISMPVLVPMCKFQKLTNHGKLVRKIIWENKVKQEDLWFGRRLNWVGIMPSWATVGKFPNLSSPFCEMKDSNAYFIGLWGWVRTVMYESHLK